MLREIISIVAASALTIALFMTMVAVAMAPALIIARQACYNNSQMSGLNTEWRIAGGCYVDVGGGKFIPYDKWIADEVKVKINEQ